MAAKQRLQQNTVPTEEVKVDIFDALVEVEVAEKCLEASLNPTKSKKCVKKWLKYLVVENLTIAVAITGALDGSRDYFIDPFIHELFIFIAMLDCFFSISGIVPLYVLCFHWCCSSSGSAEEHSVELRCVLGPDQCYTGTSMVEIKQ